MGLDSLEVFRTSILCTEAPDQPCAPQSALPWKKPAIGVVKTNWNAAIDAENNHMGVGVIVRDAVGAVVASLCSVVPYIIDLVVAEAVALWKAVELCTELELPRLHLEGDCWEIVQALLMEGTCWRWYGHLIEESRYQLDTFHDWSVSHTRKEANEAINWSAKAALTQSLNYIWRGSYPEFIQSTVLAE